MFQIFLRSFYCETKKLSICIPHPLSGRENYYGEQKIVPGCQNEEVKSVGREGAEPRVGFMFLDSCSRFTVKHEICACALCLQNL